MSGRARPPQEPSGGTKYKLAYEDAVYKTYAAESTKSGPSLTLEPKQTPWFNKRHALPQDRARPAPKQRELDRGERKTVSDMDYNIWYNMSASESRRDREMEAAKTRINVDEDVGWTRGEDAHEPYVCLYFARGCCQKGKECLRLHRLPDARFDEGLGIIHDCFGRTKKRDHNESMNGAGSFLKPTSTLYISGIPVEEMLADGKHVEVEIFKIFGEFGEVDHLRIFTHRCFGFIRFKLRAAAEFALAAMAGQTTGYGEVLQVTFALDDPNPGVQKRLRLQRERQALEAFVSKYPEKVAQLLLEQRKRSYPAEPADEDAEWTVDPKYYPPPPVYAPQPPMQHAQLQARPADEAHEPKAKRQKEAPAPAPAQAAPSALAMVAGYGSDDDD